MENYFTFSLILGNIWLEESVKDIPPVLCKEEYGDINNKFKEDVYIYLKCILYMFKYLFKKRNTVSQKI